MNDFELLAVNTPIDSPYGRHRFAREESIAIDDNGNIDINAEYSTHKIIGVYSSITSTGAVLILTDVITNEPKIVSV